MLKKALSIFAIIWFLALFVCIWLGYGITSPDSDGLRDGLGRHLSEAPILMRIFFGQDRMWAGWGWFIGDLAIFWGSIAITINVAKHFEDE